MNIATENLPNNSERWGSINGYLNYEVSWFGRVRNATTGRILKGGLTKGYRMVCLSKEGRIKTHTVHVLVAREWVPNPENKRCVDHIDGDKANNNWENLRYATHTENSRNQKNQTNTSSVYKGVYLHKPTKKWMAYIRINKKIKNLGYHASEREAAKAYNKAALEHFGIFAKVNTIID